MSIQPADGMIAAALADIEKWEKQEPSFNAPAKKRTLRLLPLAQERLQKSGNKNDPSWIHVQERLTALQARLEGAAVIPQTNPATFPPISPTSVTTKPVVASKIPPTTPNTPTTSTSTTTQATMLSHDRTRLLKLRRDCECAKSSMNRRRFSDASYLAQVEASHARMAEQLHRYLANFPQDPDVQATVPVLEQYAAVIAQAKIIGVEDAALAAKETLLKEMERTRQEVQRWGAQPFQSEEYRQKQVQLVQTYKVRGQAVANDDAYSAKMDQLDQLVTSYQNEALAILNELGDWRATLQQAQAFRDATDAKPTEPSMPYQAADVKEFFSKAQQYESSALIHCDRLKAIVDKAYMPNSEQGNQVKSALWNLQDSLRSVQKSVQSVSSNLECQMEHMDSQLDWFATKDPLNRLDQVNIYIGEKGDQQVKRLNEMLVNTQAAIAYATEMCKNDLLAAYEKVRSRIDDTREKFLLDRQVAWEGVRMPPPAEPTSCGYEELEDIARTTLANPKYEVGEIVRLVVNTDKRCGLQRQEKELKINDVDTFGGKVSLSGTETVTTWIWDEFQCCTAESGDDGKYFLYYNTLKLFHSGSRVTPTGRWVIGDRHLSTEIPFENIAL